MSTARSYRAVLISASLFLCAVSTAFAQKEGIKSITADELRMHLGFVASDETEGRGTPSTGANVVAKYLATVAGGAGLKPIMPDGSFFQGISIAVPSVSESRSRLIIKGDAGQSDFYIPKDFGGNLGRGGKLEGGILFVGCGLQGPKEGWNDFAGLDLKGKIVVALDGQVPPNHPMSTMQVRVTRQMAPMMGGAAAILTVISPQREKDLQALGGGLKPILQPALEEQYQTNAINRAAVSEMQSRLPMRADISHAVATRILGITEDELNAMFTSLAEGKQVPGREIPATLELNVETDTRHDRIRNVLAVVEGTDPVLKKEYVVISAHYDHLGIRNGRTFNGANDDGSGTAALLEVGQALMLQRPKRSVILAWFTGEEMGLWGSNHFVNRSPVPLEAISADINLDMIGRNDPGVLFLVGSNSLSTELDKVLQAVSSQALGLTLDYTYNDKNHPDRYYSRSDNYPFIQMGVPAVAFFTGMTPDYHQAGDTIDKIDFDKMEKITRFTYAAAMEIGNRPGLLKLDADPNVTARGKQNIKPPTFPKP